MLHCKPIFCASAGREMAVRFDKEAWYEDEILVHRTGLRHYLLRLTRSEEMAKDLEQETFAKIYALSDPGKIQNPRAFLFRVAHNQFIQNYRKERNSPIDAVEDFDQLSVKDMCVSADERLISKERLTALGEAIDLLPPQARRVFIMRKVFDLSHKEISEALSLSPKTIEKHVAKGLKRCRAYLKSRDLYWDNLDSEVPIRKDANDSAGDAS